MNENAEIQESAGMESSFHDRDLSHYCGSARAYTTAAEKRKSDV
jgi:hypothetical protein